MSVVRLPSKLAADGVGQLALLAHSDVGQLNQVYEVYRCVQYRLYSTRVWFGLESATSAEIAGQSRWTPAGC